MLVEVDPSVLYENNNCIVTLTLKRPPVNVINISMLEQLVEELESAAKDDCIGALILKADGKMFSAGVDVADHTPEKVGDMIPLFNRACQLLADFPVPTIAIVHGHALGGGCEFVLCCDMAVMAEGKKIGQPEIQLAAFAPIAAMRLPAIVGSRIAADMLFTGRNLSSNEALQFGIVNEVLPADEVEAWAYEKANIIAKMSHSSQRINKKAFQLGKENWANSMTDLEKLYLDKLMNTQDAHEGIQAFIEKRQPNWEHK